MRRKIQHDAVNNQEDEDSCAYPSSCPGNESFENKEKKSAENSVIYLFSEESANKEKLTGDPKYP
jgi:hypothetical protein